MAMDIIDMVFEKYSYLSAAILFGVGFLIWLATKSRNNEENDPRRSIWSYIFIWPLILTKKDQGKVVSRGLTRREWIGWLIVSVVAVIAIIFTPSKSRASEIQLIPIQVNNSK
jgi:EamA domain-containing membrane protein RarD